MDRRFFGAGAVLAFIAVAAGAFGAHLLRQSIGAEHLATWETAARYQMYHALALLVVAWAITQFADSRLFVWTGRLFIAGIVIFCTTLYAIALGGPRWLGAITPIGGLCFLAGWACAAVGALRRR
jgi:uncharacterized membrane protein YgdD (TMEM256/DUF423 family)